MEDSCPSGGNHRQVLAVQDQVDPAMAEVFSGHEFELVRSVNERKV